MKTKKVLHSTTTQIINEKTGEISMSEITNTFVVDKEPDFIKLYISDISRLNDLPKGMDPILLELIKGLGYNNVIAAYKPIKLMICKQLGISMSYLNKAINTFYVKGIFIRLARGIYIADPELFGRGSWKDIKQLRLVIDYNDDGTKTIKSNLPEKMQLKLNL